MNSIIYKKILLMITILFLTACSSKANRYSDLTFFDFLQNKEQDIHSKRVYALNSKIDGVRANIGFYKKKIKQTKYAIANMQSEVSRYNSLINNVNNNIHNIRELNYTLNQFQSQIYRVEQEFDRVKRISKGLERISKAEFLRLKKEGYFSQLNWLDYLEVVQEVIEYKQEIAKQIKSSKKNIRYAKRHTKKVLGKILKWGAKKVLRKLIPPLAIYDALETVYSVGKWLFSFNLNREERYNEKKYISTSYTYIA